MKKYILFTVLSILFWKVSLPQEPLRTDVLGNQILNQEAEYAQYVQGEVIIMFKEGCLNNDVLEKYTSGSFKASEAKPTRSVQSSDLQFYEDYSNFSLRKVVTKYKPSNGFSVSRSGKVIENNSFKNLMILQIDESKNVLEQCRSLEEYSCILFAEPNYILELDDSPPNDSFYGFQDGFEQSNDKDIDANRAWDFTTGNEGVKIAIIDNGVDYHNFDLGNGAFNTPGAKVRGGWDYVNNDNNPDDLSFENGVYSHGTPVAGIAGALRNNSTGVAGLAGGDIGNIGAQIIALKVGNGNSINTGFAIDAIIEGSSDTPGFGYGCHVLNNSWGGTGYNESLRSAISFASQNNVVFVASKGNDNSGSMHYPSDYDRNWVLSVGATDSNDERVDFPLWGSNFGNGIDVSAPGTVFNVYTTATVEDGNWRAFDGTSAAAPHVAGQGALILSEAIEQGLSLHHEDVESIIEISSEDVNGGGYDDDLGHGRINAGRSLEMMNEPWEIAHHTVTGGTAVNSTGPYIAQLQNSGGGLASALYEVVRYEVRTDVSLPPYLSDTYVWGRGTNESTGWSAASPNYQIGFCDVFASTPTTATLRSYVYQVWSFPLGQYLGVWPTTSNNVVFAYTTLGIPCVDDRNITQTISPGTLDDQLVFSVSGQITANNLIESGSDVIYNAGDEIRMVASNFQAEIGSVFIATIEGCGSKNLFSEGSNLDKDDLSSFAQWGEELNTSSEKGELLEVSAHPNPFNDLLTLSFMLPESSKIECVIFDNQGREIARPIGNEWRSKGKHSVNFVGSDLESGVYFYVIRTNEYVHSGKIIKL